jgi:hypothetical protein
VRGMKSVKLEGQGVWFEKFVLFCFFIINFFLLYWFSFIFFCYVWMMVSLRGVCWCKVLIGVSETIICLSGIRK